MYRHPFRLLPCLALTLLPALPLVWADEDRAPPGLVTTLKGHSEAIYDIAYSHDGKYLVTASGDHTVRVWEAATGKELKTFAGQTGHQKIVAGVSVSPDDSLIASAGSDDNTLRVWDFPSSSSLRELAVKEGALALAVSPDGGTVAAACKDGHVRLWNSADGKPRGDSAGHAGAATAIAAASNGQTLVSTGKDRTLRFWRPSDGGPVAALVAHSAEVTGLAVHPNSSGCITTAADGTLKFWSLPPVATRLLPAHEGAVTALALSKDGSQVLSGSADRSVRLANVAGGQAVRSFGGATAAIESVALPDSGTLVAAGTADRRLLVWQASDGRLLAQPLAHGSKGGVRAVAFNPSSAQLATGGKDGTLQLWQMPPRPARSFAHPEAVRAAVVSADGKKLCTGGADGILRSWNMASPQQPERSFSGHTGAINAVAINPSGTLLASAGEDGALRFWNPADGPQTRQIGGHAGPVTSLAFHGDGQVLSAGEDGQLKLWQVPAAPGKLFAHPGEVTCAVLTPDGSHLITGCTDKQVRIWSVATGQIEHTLEGHTLGVLAVAVNGKGSQLASAGADRTVRVYDLPGGKEVRHFTLPDAVHSVAFSPDGKQIAAGLADNSIHLLEPASGKDVGTLSGHKGAVQAVLFSPRGDQLLSASLDKTVKVWTPADGKVKTTLEHPGAVRALALDREGSCLAAGGAEGVIKLWSLADGKVEARLETPGTVQGLAFSPDGKRLLVGSKDGGARVYGRDGKLVELFRHEKPVHAVAYHPDGKRLFSASGDQTVRPWSLSLLWQAVHDGAVRQAVLAANGERVVSGGADRRVKVWSSADGKLLHTLPMEEPVRSVGVSRDGLRIAACDSGKSVRVWTLPVKPQKKEPTPQEISLPEGAEAVALSSDGTRMAVALAEPKGHVRVFDVPGGHELLTLTEHQDRVRGLAFLPDNRTLLSAGDDKSVRLLDVNAQTVLEAHPGGVTALAYPTSGTQLLSAGADGKVKLWDMAKGTVLRTFGPLDRPVSAVAFNRAGTQVAAAAGKEVKVWSTADGKEVRTLTQPAEVSGVSFSADGTRLAAAAADNQVHVWNLADAHELQGFLQGGAVRAVAFHPGNNAVLVSGGDDKAVAVHTLTIARVVATGAAVRALTVTPDGHVLTADPAGKIKFWTMAGVNDRTLDAGTKNITTLAVSKNSQLLAVGSAESAVRVFALADGKLLGTIPTPGPARRLSFAPNSLALAAVCAGEGKSAATLIRTWKVPYNPGQALPEDFGQSAQTYSEVGDASDVVFAPSGSVLYSSSDNGPVRAWKFAADTPVKNFGHPNLVDAVAFSPDGKQLASGCHDGHVRIFDVAKGQQLRDIVAHATPPMVSAIYCVAWSPDGKQVLSASIDRSLKLWDAATGKLVREFKAYHEKTFPKGHQDAVFTAVFSPDGKTVASAGYDGSIKLWSTADGSVLRELANPHVKAATAGMTAAHPGPIFRLRFTADGKRLLSVGKAPQRQGYLAVWNVADGKLLYGEQLSVGNLLALAIAPDGQSLAVGTGGETGMGYVLRMPQGK